MKKSNLVKLFSILLMSVMVIMFSTNVLAADDNGFNQLTLNNSTSTGNNTNTANTSNTTNTNTNTNTNTRNTNNTNINNTNTASNTNNTNNTNNSSIYNNTNLPKTGIEDSIPVAMLVVVFGISAIYAYKKIKDYRNI